MNATNQDSVVVTIVEGSVMVYHKLDATADKSNYQLLTAGKKGTLQGSDKMVVIDENENLNFLYWYDGKLHFKEAHLSEVINVLNSFWDLKIKLQSERLDDCMLTANFSDKSIDTILEILELTLDIEIDRSEDRVMINGEGC